MMSATCSQVVHQHYYEEKYKSNGGVLIITDELGEE